MQSCEFLSILDFHPRQACRHPGSPCGVWVPQPGDMGWMSLALSVLPIWISFSCKWGGRWETWRVTGSWLGVQQETNCTEFLALPAEIWLLLLFTAFIFFFFSVTSVSLISARYVLSSSCSKLRSVSLSIIKQVQGFMPEFHFCVEMYL